MNRVCSIFAQVLRLLPRAEFEQAVQKHQAEKHAKGFSCWAQLIAMLFCQLGQAKSLREIVGGLASSEGKLKHLGVEKPPKRSTLAYANEHRTWELYQTVFEQVLDRGWEWGSRFDCLWMLPAIINAEHDRVRTAALATIRNAALTTRDAILADFVRWHPNPVLVDRCQDETFAPCMGIGTLRVDLLQWFKQDPRFAEAWTDYVHEGQAGPYDLWCRKGEADVCRRILADTE